MTSSTLSVEPLEIPGQQTQAGVPFPLVLGCPSKDVTIEEVDAWIGSSRSQLQSQLANHGAILFRDFPLSNHNDFDAFIRAFGYPNFAYEDSLSNAVRMNRTERVFTANEAPAEVTIYLHHEMAQTPIYPSKLFFFCEQAAESGGATPLCRSDVLYDRIQADYPEFARTAEAKGLKYTNVMPPAADLASGMGRSWQSTLRAEDRSQAEAKLKELGYSWVWQSDGSLQATTPVLAAVRELPDGRKSFFNQLIAAYKGWKDTRNDSSKAITWGDGTPLDRDTVLQIAELAEQLTFNVPWQAGDVALVDNYLVMHGRRTFQGTRKVLASLVGGES